MVTDAAWTAGGAPERWRRRRGERAAEQEQSSEGAPGVLRELQLQPLWPGESVPFRAVPFWGAVQGAIRVGLSMGERTELQGLVGLYMVMEAGEAVGIQGFPAGPEDELVAGGLATQWNRRCYLCVQQADLFLRRAFSPAFDSQRGSVNSV